MCPHLNQTPPVSEQPILERLRATPARSALSSDGLRRFPLMSQSATSSPPGAGKQASPHPLQAGYASLIGTVLRVHLRSRTVPPTWSSYEAVRHRLWLPRRGACCGDGVDRHEVVGIDVDQRKIDALSKGEAPFFEPGLQEILTAGIAAGNLRFTTDMAEAAGAKVHFVGVGTPQQKDSYAADLTYVNGAFDGLLPYLAPATSSRESRPSPSAPRRAWLRGCRRPAPRWCGTPSSSARVTRCKTLSTPTASSRGCRREKRVRSRHPCCVRSNHPSVAKGTPFIVTDYAPPNWSRCRRTPFSRDQDQLHQRHGRDRREVTGADVTQLADAIGMTRASAGASSVPASVSVAGVCRRTSARSLPVRRSSGAVSPSRSCVRSTRSTCAAATAPCNSWSTVSAARSTRRR